MFVGKDLSSNVNVGQFEGSHRIAAVRHPWLISGGGLPETRVQHRILDNIIQVHAYADLRYA